MHALQQHLVAAAIAVVLLCTAIGASAQSAQTFSLGIDHFVVNGQARYLFFIGYFDGLRMLRQPNGPATVAERRGRRRYLEAHGALARF
jgi:hypothetical protein